VTQSSAQVSSQERCSERQLVNSGGMGKVLGGKERFRSSSTGLPTRVSAAARLSEGMTKEAFPQTVAALRQPAW